MGRILVMYDLSGIQDFIFSTNRVKEIVGASCLVSNALFGNVPRLLGEKRDAWRTYDVGDYRNIDVGQGRTVYIGGGNALALFGSADAATSCTKALKREVFLQTGGALRICSARIEVDDSTRLAECLDPANERSLRALLDTSKAEAPHAATARGFSVDALDNDALEPLVYFEKPVHDQGKWKHAMSRSRFLKLAAYEQQEDVQGKSMKTPLLDLMGGRTYEVELDDFFKESEAKNKGKHYLAIVHIDGNTMGQRIAGFLSELGNRQASFEEDLMAMRDFSAFINDVYRNALSSTIDEVFGSQGDAPLAFRPVVADGDDITFICRSEKAFACVDAFVRALHQSQAGESRCEGMPDARDLGIGAGIAFVNSSYPFSKAYNMAEELCKNAKKRAILRFGPNPERPVSSVDFHVCSGEVFSSVADYRERRLVLRSAQEEEQARLCIRPYYLADDTESITRSELRYDLFIQQVSDLLNRSNPKKCAGKPWIARGKLKGLRDKYGQGVDQVRRYAALICERDLAMQRMGDEGGQKRSDFIQSFANPFAELPLPGKTTLATYAKFFDALDVLDLCEEEEVDE